MGNAADKRAAAAAHNREYVKPKEPRVRRSRNRMAERNLALIVGLIAASPVLPLKLPAGDNGEGGQ